VSDFRVFFSGRIRDLVFFILLSMGRRPLAG
jgi:hypothetical protein